MKGTSVKAKGLTRIVNDIKFDMFLADGGTMHTRDVWTYFFNRSDDDRFALSLPHYLIIGCSEDEKLITCIRRQCKRYTVSCAGTRFWLLPSSEQCVVVHNYGSKKVEPIVKQVLIPEFSIDLCALEDVRGLENGLPFLQACFDEQDYGRIKSGLENLSGLPASKIYMWAEKGGPEGAHQIRGAVINAANAQGHFIINCAANSERIDRCFGGALVKPGYKHGKK